MKKQQNVLVQLLRIAAVLTLFLAILMPISQGAERVLEDFAVGIVFVGVAIGLWGTSLVMAGIDPLTLTNQISVSVLWMMGCLMTAFFLTFVWTDPPEQREYALGMICGLPSLFMCVMGILLYRHEAQRSAVNHPFDDPADTLKEPRPTIVPVQMGLLLAVLLIIIVIFDVWVAVTVPFPQ